VAVVVNTKLKLKMVNPDGAIDGWFYGLGSVSIILSITVATCLYRIGIRSASTRLVFILQITQLMEEIWSFPDVYIEPLWLCRISTGVKEYFTMSNLLANFFMSYYSYTMIFTSSVDSKYQVSKASQAIVFLFPLIMFLPMITDGYGPYQEYWCSYLRTGKGDIWFASFLAIEFFIVSASLFCVGIIIVRLMNVGDGNYGAVIKVVRSSGLYSIVTICCWFPKVFTLNDRDFHSSSPDAAIFSARLFTYVVGLLYFVIFLMERKSLSTFETYVQDQVVESSLGYNDSFSSVTSSSRPSLASSAPPAMLRMSMISETPRIRIHSNISTMSPIQGALSRTTSNISGPDLSVPGVTSTDSSLQSAQKQMMSKEDL
jgi:hypothetical protein